MAMLIQIEKKDGKTIRKMVYVRDWDTHIKFLTEPLTDDAIAEGGLKTFSINKRGDRAVNKVEWPDSYEFLEILKKDDI